MKVTLLNGEDLKNSFFKTWGVFATECYNTPVEFAEKVGNYCFESEHYSGSRTEYIKFKIEGVDRGVAEQIMRHEIGVRQFPISEYTYDENPNNIVKNMKSFRYVDMNNFEYSIPKTILNNQEACDLYNNIIQQINKTRSKIKNCLISTGIDQKKANEDANYILPRATHTSLCIGFTLEALIHYMHKRLCLRTQHFHRELAKLMKQETLKVLPELKDRLTPQCEYLLWCPEQKTCGKFPRKDEIKEILNKEVKQLHE